jgi:hypothetical protein
MEVGCQTPDGHSLCDNINWTAPPEDDSRSGIQWAGEWTVTYETFRDMGMAFGAALVLIYILVVWEFGNFRIPALIMAPIPLTLLGIIPAHLVFFQMGWGGEFTATSMIGWIALAGIIVRNSILLVDFSVHLIRQGTPVVEAVITSCKTRTRPIVITALALVAGSSVIFFDPIFQGMAISLASGVLVSTVLTLIVIPLGCVQAADSLCEVAGVDCQEKNLLTSQTKGQNSAPGAASSGTPLLMKLWSGLMSIIFAVIGIVTWILGLFKRKPSSPPPAPSPTSAPVTSPAAPASDSMAEPTVSATSTSNDMSGSRFGSRLDTPKKRPVDDSAEAEDDADQPARSSYRRGIRLKSDED